MPTTHPRVSAVVNEELAEWLRERSRRQGRSVSTLVREILERFYAEEEERFWAREGEDRLATFEPAEALSHHEAWE